MSLKTNAVNWVVQFAKRLITPMVLVGFTGFVVWLTVSAFPTVFTWAYWDVGQGLPTTKSEIVRNLGLLLVGSVGVAFGVWRAYTAHQQSVTAIKQTDISERGHFTDRFTAAIEHLGSEKLPVRLGGIHALWQLAQDEPDDKNVWRVLDILCAYVRHPPHALASVQAKDSHIPPDTDTRSETNTPATAGEETTLEYVLPDVQAILTLIASAHPQIRAIIPEFYSFNFSGADLTGATLIVADLSRADLSGANLTGADLNGADLRSTYLYSVNLSKAILSGADLRGAYLFQANLSGADLNRADLTGAVLKEAYLSKAYLNEADLSRVDLSGVNLRGAKNLTADQLEKACQKMDLDGPKLPTYLTDPPNNYKWHGRNCARYQ